MGIAVQRMLAKLAMLGLLVGSLSLAQRTSSAQDRADDADSQPAVAPTTPPEMFPGLTFPTSRPADAPTATPEVFPNPNLQKSRPEWSPPDESLPDESVVLDGSACGNCSVGTCCAVCGGGSCCPPAWYLDQGARVLTHLQPRLVLTTTELIPGAETVFEPRMTTRSLGLGESAGYLGTVGHYLGRDIDNRDHFVEFTYSGMNNWQTRVRKRGIRLTDSGTLASPVTFGSLFSPFDEQNGFVATIGGFNRADMHTLTYQAEIHNYELNARLSPRSRPDRLVLHPNGRWRRECQPGCYVSYLFGIRYLSLDEAFNFHSVGKIRFEGTSRHVSGDYDILTHNSMVGLQLGTDVIFRQCRWNWGFRAKVGPLLNFTDQRSHVITEAVDLDPFATTELNRHHRIKNDAISLVGEVGIVGSYKIRPHMVVHAAYDFIWLTGVALAPEQLDFDNDPAPSLNDNGTLNFHGLTLTLEFVW